MAFNGNNPNGLNQTSVNSVSLFVSGASILNASSESVNVVGNFTASKIQTDEIDSFGTNPLQIKANTQISGSANISSSISASLFIGDGGGLFNISATALGDLDRLKSGSATAIISPNKGLVVNTDLTVAGKIKTPSEREFEQLKIALRKEDLNNAESKFGEAMELICNIFTKKVLGLGPTSLRDLLVALRSEIDTGKITAITKPEVLA